MSDEFVHLHVHSEYTMLDASIRIGELVAGVAEQGMGAVALTDQNNMFGTLQFANECAARDIKPIIGCEINVCEDLNAPPASRVDEHLVVLASSPEGYANLVRLVSLGWVQGMVHGIPSVDYETLAAHRKGVVGLTACMAGLIPQRVLRRGVDAGRDALGKLKDVFEPEHLYVELQDHGFPESAPLMEALVEIAAKTGLPTVATNDCHFLHKEAARSHLVLQCIGAGRRIEEMRATHHGSAEMYLKSPAEMVHLFRHHPESIKNTLKVAEMCAGQVSPFAAPKLPRFDAPGGATEAEHLVELANSGLQERLARLDSLGVEYDTDVYAARLTRELDVIQSMGFPGYFLIVADFINWAKENDIPVGPGRGSGAGSLVAYSLRITDLDPIPYGLLFERFLNPERVSMPDFDIDFCMDGRDKVIDYVRHKYGQSSVGQIATFHQLKSRSCVRDVGRVMGLTATDAGKIASMIPEPVAGKSIPIGQALESEVRLKANYESDAITKELVDTAMELENLTRHAGMHAAGVVISEGPIWDHVPVFCPEPEVFVTQYHKDDVEAAGLVKFDFLGLKTLTVLDIARRLIDRRPDREGQKLSLEDLPMKDKATFALLQSGETTNVFQLESSGMQGLFKMLKPDCFEDIVAAVALYRPGPMGAGMDKDFVKRKHGRAAVEFPHPATEAILSDTYGVIVYQEQVMQIAQEMAGFSLGGADLLRRAMGKKKESEMAKQKAIFIEGSKKNGHDEKDASDVFDLMAYFAGYGFNKSHSAAYALVTYQTAYLKAHFPVEFQCATLTADKDKSDKVVRTVAEARAMGITVLPPDANESEIDFSVVYDTEATDTPKRRANQPVCLKGKLRDPMSPKIRFGLGAVKGVGAAALEAVFEARTQDGAHQPFVDIFDFCSRVDLRRVNKSVIEALVQCGAFDAIHEPAGVSRAAAFAAIDQAISRGKKQAAERASGQTNLFSLLAAEEPGEAGNLGAAGIFPTVEPWDQLDLLARERQTLGFYVSGHPLDRYQTELRRFCSTTIEQLEMLDEGTKVTIGGAVEGYRERSTKAGKMAFFWLEDSLARVEVKVFSRALEQAGTRENLLAGQPVLITGTMRRERDFGNKGDSEEEGTIKLTLASAVPLAESITNSAKLVKLKIMVEDLDSKRLHSLRDTLNRYPGSCPVTLELGSRDGWSVNMSQTGVMVAPTDSLMAGLERLFGTKVCEFR